MGVRNGPSGSHRPVGLLRCGMEEVHKARKMR